MKNNSESQNEKGRSTHRLSQQNNTYKVARSIIDHSSFFAKDKKIQNYMPENQWVSLKKYSRNVRIRLTYINAKGRREPTLHQRYKTYRLCNTDHNIVGDFFARTNKPRRSLCPKYQVTRIVSIQV